MVSLKDILMVFLISIILTFCSINFYGEKKISQTCSKKIFFFWISRVDLDQSLTRQRSRASISYGFRREIQPAYLVYFFWGIIDYLIHFLFLFFEIFIFFKATNLIFSVCVCVNFYFYFFIKQDGVVHELKVEKLIKYNYITYLNI